MDWLVITFIVIASLFLIFATLLTDKIQKPRYVIPILLLILTTCIFSIIYLPEMLFPNQIRGKIENVVFYHDKNDKLKAWIITDDSSYSTDENHNTRASFKKIRNFIYDPTSKTVDVYMKTDIEGSVPRFKVYHKTGSIWVIAEQFASSSYQNLIMKYDATTGEELLNEKTFLQRYPHLSGRIESIKPEYGRGDLIFRIHTEDEQTSFYNVDKDTLAASFEREDMFRSLRDLKERAQEIENDIGQINEQAKRYEASENNNELPDAELAQLNSELSQIKKQFAPGTSELLGLVEEKDSRRRAKLYRLSVENTFLPIASEYLQTHQFYPEYISEPRTFTPFLSAQKVSDKIYLNAEILFQDKDKAILRQTEVGADPFISCIDWNGKQIWVSNAPFTSTALVKDVLILLNDDDEHFLALDIHEGKYLWQVQL